MSELAGFSAFKEWQAVVAAIHAGRQTIILRKGGIAEGRRGFRPRGEPFWLLPTQFHAQADKLKPDAAPFLSPPNGDASGVQLTTWAELHGHRFIDEWDEVAALAPLHGWTESTVRERFDWSKPAGIHLLVIRAHALTSPVPFQLTEAQAGCKSWVKVPIDPTTLPSAPAIDDPEFGRITANLGLRP